MNDPIEILIVEDSSTQAITLEYLLEKNDYKVIRARSGQEALQRIRQKKPEMVITKVAMAEMDGYALCRQIKADPTLKEIPVILLTSLADPQDIVRGLESGANNFFVKPYEEKFLISRIRYILANQELRQSSMSAIGMEIIFGGQKYFITPDRIQMIDLLLSTYETAVQRNLELERTRTNYHTLLETTADAVIVVDHHQIIRFVNPSAESLLGRKAEDLLGKTVEFPVKANETTELAIRRRDDTSAIAEMRVVETYWQGESAVLASLRDITRRKQAEDIIQQQNQELVLLNRVTQLFSSSLELDQVLKTVLEEVQRLLGAYSISFWLLDRATDELVCMHAKDPNSQKLIQQRVKTGQGITGWAAQHNESVLIPDAWADERHLGLTDNFRSMLSIPLRVKGNVIGVLNLVDPRIGHFTEENVRFLEPIAAAAAIAIENARLYTMAQQEIAERARAEAALAEANRELQRLASLDGLTQLANRRQFDEYLQREWKCAVRDQSPLSLIMCDIDYFKRYNDTYGHQAGDECLKQVARAMTQAVKRPADLVARYGGEEFTIVLPQTDAESALYMAHAVQQAVWTLQIAHSGSTVCDYVTLSLGVATTIPDHSHAPEILVMAADTALYAAKEQGRNRIVMNPNG